MARDHTDHRNRRCLMMLISLALLSTAALSGCATTLEAQVTSFHQPQLNWAGKRFVIAPEEAQRSSLEFRAYADQVGRALQAKGLLPGQGTAGDLQVRLRYAIRELPTAVYDASVYGYGAVGLGWGWGYPWAYYGPFHNHHYWAPYAPLGAGAWGVRAYRIWRRELQVVITTPADTENQFESTAVSDGQTDSLVTVMPALIAAVFHDFPGPSGVPRQLTVKLEAPRAAAAAIPAAPGANDPAAARPATNSGARTESDAGGVDQSRRSQSPSGR